MSPLPTALLLCATQSPALSRRTGAQPGRPVSAPSHPWPFPGQFPKGPRPSRPRKPFHPSPASVLRGPSGWMVETGNR